MSRSIAGFLFVFSVMLPISAAIFPEQLGTLARSVVTTDAPKDPVFEEYGFDAGEKVSYGDMVATGWRFKDTTGALAAFQFLKPGDATASDLDVLASTSKNGTLAAHGNYLFQFHGGVPDKAQYAQIVGGLTRQERSALPAVTSYLPALNLISNSEKYILGPVSLERFDKGISPSLAAFHLSAEGQFARYKAEGGELNLTIFVYPTPSMSRERAEAFRKLPGAVVKRTGPMVAVILSPPNADSAEKLLAKVNYKAQVTLNEKTPTSEARGLANMMLGIFKLAGIILVFCLLSGLGFALIQQLLRRGGKQGADEGMLRLNLGPK